MHHVNAYHWPLFCFLYLYNAIIFGICNYSEMTWHQFWDIKIEYAGIWSWRNGSAETVYIGFCILSRIFGIFWYKLICHMSYLLMMIHFMPYLFSLSKTWSMCFQTILRDCTPTHQVQDHESSNECHGFRIIFHRWFGQKWKYPLNNIESMIMLLAQDSHYNVVIMGAMVSYITSLTIVYSTVYSSADQRKHQSSASLAFVRGNHRGPVNSPRKCFYLMTSSCIRRVVCRLIRCSNITSCLLRLMWHLSGGPIGSHEKRHHKMLTWPSYKVL